MESVGNQLQKRNEKGTVKLVFVLFPIFTLLFGFGAGLLWTMGGGATDPDLYGTFAMMGFPFLVAFILVTVYYLRKIDRL